MARSAAIRKDRRETAIRAKSPDRRAILEVVAEEDAPPATEPVRANSVVAVMLWGGLAAALAAAAFLAIAAAGGSGSTMTLAVGAVVGAGLLVAVGLMRMLSPGLLATNAVRARRSDDAGKLAGSNMLAALGIAEKILDADADCRLVTRRDGVVVYANAAYRALAAEAGVAQPGGLPPRVDRLFAQQGAEATKVFRLCRAAKSAAAHEEIIYQTIGLAGGGDRRRFEVAVRPVPGSDAHVAWRLRELPIAEKEHDALAAAFADYVRPILAVEKSGQIAWSNAAARERLGRDRAALTHIDDIVLGESGDLVRALWQVDQSPQKATVRQRGGDAANGALTGFRRGGAGEGFVCVELALDAEKADEEELSASGDVSEAPFGVAIVEGEINGDARVVEANRAFTDDFGGTKKNAPLGRLFASAALEELDAEIRRKAASGGAPRPIEAIAGEGALARTYALYARPVRRRRGAYGARRTLLFTVDVTDRKRMEEEHAQDQKLKAIGRLAGEVAHDFNNVLQVVLGNCERLMLRHPAGDPAYKDLVLIRENAQRAANMTKQLLAFSRKQTLKREVVSITEVLRDFARFLNRAVGEKVRIDLVNGRNLPAVRVDRNQLETAVMNLAVNARDAMAPDGGTLTIRTKAIPAEEAGSLALPNFAAQDCLLIEVSDTGPGVPKDIADKIFDPFFTTKAEGKGTGLGLSTVHGIIGQMDGAIAVGEAEGGGAAFRIYLPACADTVEEAPPAVASAADLTGAGRILVVEDEDAVRNFVAAALEDCGYEVTPVADGVEALEVLAKSADFDLVVSDVMMPELDGPTMIARARAELGLASRVVFMSAYAENAVREQLDQVDGAGYIQKPFTLKGLAAKVKEALAPAP